MKCLILGDSPFGTTGFGRVQRQAAEAFLAEGWELAAVTGLQWHEAETSLPIKQYIPERGDGQGITVFKTALEEFQPDVIYTTGDPGTVTSWTAVIPAHIPFFAYVPIEGEPIVLRDWQAVLHGINWMTASEYGSKIAKRDADLADVKWAYHGVDHDIFYKYDEERRNKIRADLGWTDKFVVLSVAANVRRKQHPRLFEAIALLKSKNYNDIVLYDHTVPFQNFWLDGWNLPQIASAFNVSERIYFHPDLTGFGRGVEDSTLADVYNAADCFVLVSQVEGFGLPIAEAMACGLPVITTKYAAGWEVARKGNAIGIEPYDWEIAKSGTRYANVDPRTVANAIQTLYKNPKRRQRMSAAGIEAAKAFDWNIFRKEVVDGVKAAFLKGSLEEADIQGASTSVETDQGLQASEKVD